MSKRKRMTEKEIIYITNDVNPKIMEKDLLYWFAAYKLAEEITDMGTKDLAGQLCGPDGVVYSITKWEEVLDYIKEAYDAEDFRTELESFFDGYDFR